jgi:hypothetical protein
MNSPENMYLSRRHLAKPAEKKRKKKTCSKFIKTATVVNLGNWGGFRELHSELYFQLKQYANSTDISKVKKKKLGKLTLSLDRVSGGDMIFGCT